MIKAIIIENEKIASDLLESMLKKIEIPISIEGIASSVKEAINLILNLNPDIVFLDIELDQGDGFEVLSSIEEKNFQVIFTTGHDTFYKEAMDHFALSYILKPIDKDKLEASIKQFERIRSHEKNNDQLKFFKQFMQPKNEKLFLHVDESFFPIVIEDIILCISNGNYTKFLLENEESYLATGILKNYEKLLGKHSFFRANRSTLINLKHVKKVHKKETIVLTNTMNIPIATRRRHELDTILKSLI